MEIRDWVMTWREGGEWPCPGLVVSFGSYFVHLKFDCNNPTHDERYPYLPSITTLDKFRTLLVLVSYFKTSIHSDLCY